MRLRGIAAIADKAEDLTALYMVAELDANLARLKVRVECVVAAADIDDDVIAAYRLERDRDCPRVGARPVLGDAVLHLSDDAIGDGEGVVTVREIILVIERVAAMRCVSRVDLDPIDREALGYIERTGDRDHRSPMAALRARTIGGEPRATTERRRDDDGLARHRRGGRFEDDVW